MNKKWTEMTGAEKTVTVISLVALCTWLLFEILEETTSLGFAKYVNYTAIIVICVCEAISFWKTRRALSYVAIGGAVFMLAVVILEIMFQF